MLNAATTTLTVMELEEVIENIRFLPPTPEVLPKLQKLMSDPNSNVNDILALIKVNVSLTAQIVRVANSSFYGGSSKVENLDQAVNRIGFHEVYKVVAFVATNNILGDKMILYRLKPGELWQQSIRAAMLLQVLTRVTGIDDDTAYTIGLLHSIGRIILNYHYLENTESYNFALGGEIEPEQEREYFGADYAEAGYVLLRKWSFPEGVAEPIRYQLDPLNAPSHKRLTCLLALGVYGTQHMNARPKYLADLVKPDPELLEVLSLEPEELVNCIIQAKANLNDINDLVDAL